MDVDDHLLEEALATYSREEARAGLEQRVLAGVTSHHAGPRWMWPVFVFAAACLVIIVATSRRDSTPIHPIHVVSAKTPAPVVPARHTQPRRDYFPSRAPLTSEERAWMRLGDSGVVPDMSAAIEPIQIEDL